MRLFSADLLIYKTLMVNW